MKSSKRPLLPFGPKPGRRSGSRNGSAGSADANRWTRQSAQRSEREPGATPRSAGLGNTRPQKRSGTVEADLDLLSALSAREAAKAAAASPRNGQAVPSGRAGSAARSGGRIRMDAPKAVRTGPRAKAIPSAPRYRPNARPVNWRAIFLVTLSALIVAYGATYLMTSPTLSLQKVEITGVSPETAALLQADLPGEPIGSNLLRYAFSNHASIRRNIGGAEADFASVHVGIHLPHTLVVDIVKRVPVAMLAVGDSTWALDERAIPIRLGSDPQVSELALMHLVVTPAGSLVSAPTLGRPLPAQIAPQVRDGILLMKRLGHQPGLSGIESIQVDALENVTLALAGNLRIKLGQPIDLDTKLALARTLMQQHPDVATQAAYIDLSYPARPAMLPKGAKITTAAPAQGALAPVAQTWRESKRSSH